MTVAKLAELLNLLDDAGYGDEDICVGHDELFIPGPETDDRNAHDTDDANELAEILSEEYKAHDCGDGTWSIFI